jgi:amidophosphoribosyltransferase
MCSVCFDGNYPIELPRQTARGKDVMQCTLANAARTGANPASVMQSENDNVPALRRP